MKLLKTSMIVAAAVAAVMSSSGGEVRAEYPEKTVTIIVPFAAGGRTDLTARSIAQALEKQLGTTTVVVNKPGAGGVVGAKEVANARPDGYTVGVFSSAVVSAQYTVETGTDLDDYDIAGVMEISPAALAVNYDAPWQSLNELVEAGDKEPGSIRLGMIPGASAQVFAGGFADAAGIETTMVPFDSDAPGVTALAGGHIDAHVAVPASYKALMEANKIRVLGVAAENRMSTFPDIPTMREQDVDLVIGSFHGLFVPKGTPEEVLGTLETALEKAMQDEAVIEQMANVGLGPVFLDRQAGERFLAGQDATYEKLIDQMGMMHESKKK